MPQGGGGGGGAGDPCGQRSEDAAWTLCDLSCFILLHLCVYLFMFAVANPSKTNYNVILFQELWISRALL